MGAAEVKAGAVNTMSSVSVTEALGSHAHVGAGNETLGHIKEGARMRTPPPPRLAAGILGGLQPQGKYRSGEDCPPAQPENRRWCLTLLRLRGRDPPLGNKNSGPGSHILSLSLYYPEV